MTAAMVLGTFGLLALTYSAYVLYLVLRSLAFTRRQKFAQSVIVIGIPIFGAAFVHFFLRTDDEEPAIKDDKFVPDEIGSG